MKVEARSLDGVVTRDEGLTLSRPFRIVSRCFVAEHRQLVAPRSLPATTS